MEDGNERAQDLKSRQTLGCTVAPAAFLLTELVFILRYDNGFVLGLLPAVLAAAIVGWLSYRFLWLGVLISIILELLSSLG